MVTRDRGIEHLSADYAAALRDGSIVAFCSGLTKTEAELIRSSTELAEVMAMAHLINQVAYADRAVCPALSEFTARVVAAAREKDPVPTKPSKRRRQDRRRQPDVRARNDR